MKYEVSGEGCVLCVEAADAKSAAEKFAEHMYIDGYSCICIRVVVKDFKGNASFWNVTSKIEFSAVDLELK